MGISGLDERNFPGFNALTKVMTVTGVDVQMHTV
jgi:hypothetical protein